MWDYFYVFPFLTEYYLNVLFIKALTNFLKIIFINKIKTKKHLRFNFTVGRVIHYHFDGIFQTHFSQYVSQFTSDLKKE